MRSLAAANMLHPVHYSAVRFDATPHLHSSSRTNIYVPTIAACNKASEWAYENEWRFVVPGGIANANPSFGFAAPSRIILGAKAPQAVQDTLQGIPRLTGMPVVRATLSKSEFQIEF